MQRLRTVSTFLVFEETICLSSQNSLLEGPGHRLFTVVRMVALAALSSVLGLHRSLWALAGLTPLQDSCPTLAGLPV